MKELFNAKLTESELANLLAKKTFRKIGEGFSAHVLGATDKSVVLKIFPQLIARKKNDYVR